MSYQMAIRGRLNALSASRSNAIFSQRFIHAGFISRLPTGQHMAASGEELKAEHDQHMKSGNKDWNEKLATHSEAGVRAEKDTRNVAALQEETIKNSQGSN